MAAGGRTPDAAGTNQRPVLLLDVMDTLVVDPFFVHMPAFFNMSFKVRVMCWFVIGGFIVLAWQDNKSDSRSSQGGMNHFTAVGCCGSV